MVMTEQQWLECDDVDLLIGYTEAISTERQRRLFACACCRRIWHLMTDKRSREAVEIAESYAEGEVGAEILQAANDAAKAAWVERSQQLDDHAAAAAFFCSISKPSLLPAAANRVQATVSNKQMEKKQQARLLKEIIGNPFNGSRLQNEG
jgi:hypothetical protein